MKGKKLSRRDFLRMSALTTAGMALAGCKPTPVPTVEKAPEPTDTPQPTATPEPTPTTAPIQPEEVVLEIGASNPEYENTEGQIWAVFEQENPGVKVEMFSVNEDQKAAFAAKIAGGWYPALYRAIVSKDDYQNYINILELDFPWFDRWEYDVRHAFEDQYGIEGVYTLDPYIGRVFTWMWHVDLMEEAGLDPRRDVRTWDDLKDFLAEGTAWVESNPDVDHFWDQGFHQWVFGLIYTDLWPLAFPDGQPDRQRQCYLGELAFNADDSPYRHAFEVFKEFYDNGWLPENCWAREWETDMEASYIAKKSVMILHGPWPWDKMLAADPSAQQLGLPSTPPAEGQGTWVQYMTNPKYTEGYSMLKAVMGSPEWPWIEKAYYWWHSPPVVKMRAENESQPVLYELDEPLELKGSQWDGILKDMWDEDGFFSDVVVDGSPKGDVVAGRYLKEGAQGVWDWASGNIATIYGDFLQGKMTVQEVLDWAQKNWEESYEGLPV